MNRLRTAVALLFQILLLQVNVLGGGMACAPAWLQSVAAARTASADEHGAPDMHAMHAMPAMPDGGEHTPVQHHGSAPTHCATTGCAAIAVTAPEVLVAPVAIVAPTVTAIRVSAPHWTHPAPEPPPPRV